MYKCKDFDIFNIPILIERTAARVYCKEDGEYVSPTRVSRTTGSELCKYTQHRYNIPLR